MEQEARELLVYFAQKLKLPHTTREELGEVTNQREFIKFLMIDEVTDILLRKKTPLSDEDLKTLRGHIDEVMVNEQKA